MRNQILPVLILSILISLSSIRHPVERPLISIKGDKDLPLKTTNGCGLAHTVIVNRGNSDSGFPPTIGYLNYFNYPLEYFSVDTLNDTIIGVAFTDVFSQVYVGGGDLRYFAIITSGNVYLYSMVPGDYNEPEIILVDSIATPEGYVNSALPEGYQSEQLLLVNQQPDSTFFTYTFYSIPDLMVLGQTNMNIRPEKIVQRSSFPQDYFMSGDSLGIHKLFEISNTSFQITNSYMLPIEADNVKSLIGYDSPDYLLSSPGDSVVNLVKFNETSLTSTITTLMHNSGVAASSLYHPDQFLFQPVVDSLLSNLGTKIIEVNASQGLIADTLNLNENAIGIESGYYLGFGGIYDFIVGTSQDISNDWVYYWNYVFDSIQAGANPTWFIGDVRCYINVEQIEKNLAIKIAPNPARDNIQIFVSGLAENKTYDFTITDINGKMLWRQQLITKADYVIPMKDFPSGILLLKVDAGSKIVTEKILKL